jgi:hypothetical protein
VSTFALSFCCQTPPWHVFLLADLHFAPFDPTHRSLVTCGYGRLIATGPPNLLNLEVTRVPSPPSSPTILTLTRRSFTPPAHSLNHRSPPPLPLQKSEFPDHESDLLIDVSPFTQRDHRVALSHDPWRCRVCRKKRNEFAWASGFGLHTTDGWVAGGEKEGRSLRRQEACSISAQRPDSASIRPTDQIKGSLRPTWHSYQCSSTATMEVFVRNG